MESDYQIKKARRAIISFTDSYTQNKQGKRNEQPESDPAPSLVEISTYLQYLRDQICYNNALKQMIKIPKLLRSLVALVTFRLGTHIDLDVDNQRLKVRSWSQRCLGYILYFGDEYVQSELVNVEYGRVLFISICTAGGKGEEQDEEIYNGLKYISEFLRELHYGRNDFYWKPSFQPFPLLVRNTEEQMEEEGAIEEIEAQMNNNENEWSIRNWANCTKAAILNNFIRRG
ncbi:MAG: hypothetical protein EZS28_038574 [Streblomastix strix]|uniref:Uncharacterized protein n=1 Tax=Streblomastix strix TaxID=222440 RepID=A0A5J4U6B3_9EUKA|nr:MAG: hypothetical protein EZS28_038574 [Streblomastix strix]